MSAANAAETQRPTLSGADRRAAEKELSAIDRKLEKLQQQILQQHEVLARHDQSDYAGLGALSAQLQAVEAEVAELETRWLELSETLEP